MRRHIPALDGIRAIACLAVIASHARIPGARGGFLGVDLFFVLSGYLITTILVAELGGTGRLRLGAFYLRRAARLYPALVAAVALACALRVFVDPAYPVSRWDIGWALTYTMDFAVVGGHWGEALVHTWSLAIEEQFYLVWPVLLLAVRSRRARLTLCGVGIVAAVAVSVTSPFEVTYFGPQVRAFELLSGCGLALAGGRLPAASVLLPVGLTAFGSAVAVGWFIFESKDPGLFLPTMALATVGSVLAVGSATDATGPVADALRSAPLRRIGEISYGAYLYHLPLITLADMQRTHRTAWFLSAAVAGLLLAEASHRWLERPILDRVKRRTAAVRPRTLAYAVE